MKIIKQTDKWIYYLDEYGRQKKKPVGQEESGKDEIKSYLQNVVKLAKANAHLKSVDSVTHYLIKLRKHQDGLTEEQRSIVETIRNMRDEQERYNPNVHQL